MSTDLDHAASVICRGGVVSHACEGVWGFACSPFNERAVRRILDIKGRRADKGLIVIGAHAEMFAPELTGLDPATRTRVVASWPGHTTWITPTTRFPRWVTGAFDSIAIRVPDHQQARELCGKCGEPLISTSANRSGSSALVRQYDIEAEFAAEIDFVLPGSIGSASGPSRIIDARSNSELR